MSLAARDQLNRLVADASDAPGETRHIVIADDGLDAVAPWLAAQFPDRTPILVCDDHTHHAAGEALERTLDASGAGSRLLVLQPRDGDDHLVCEDGVIRSLATVLRAHGGPTVAIGAGTVNDIVKMATFQVGQDYVVVPTAASMNGYTSSIAAVLSGGVKRTLSAHQPIAIFCDLSVLAAAPVHLNQAGFGDLLSKPFSNCDWLLAHEVRGVPYDDGPSILLDAAFETLLAHAEGVGTATPAGIRALIEAILLSGFSMTQAGTSAPASGGEHLVSHYWDMVQLDAGLPLVGLHGTQVGVATLLSACLYERLLRLDADAIDPDAAAARLPDDRWLDGLAALHPQLSAPIVAEIRQQIAGKQRHGAALRDELAAVKQRWPQIRARLQAAAMAPAEIRDALRAAGCVERASQLGVDRARLLHTLRVCRHIRGRYSALDLIDDIGLLHPWSALVADHVEADLAATNPTEGDTAWA